MRLAFCSVQIHPISVKLRFMNKFLACLFVLLSLPGYGATYQYQARVAGIAAGNLTVVVERGNGRYLVTGYARSVGLWEVIDNWRADFSATGTLVDGSVTLEKYELYERTNSKKQKVTVTPETLQVVKNGKIRSPAAPLPGLDVLTALFVVATCPDEQELHTGRHGYLLAKKNSEENGCSFLVTDEDEETFIAAVKYRRYFDMNVPGSIHFQGAVEGVLELVKVSE